MRCVVRRGATWECKSVTRCVGCGVRRGVTRECKSMTRGAGATQCDVGCDVVCGPVTWGGHSASRSSENRYFPTFFDRRDWVCPRHVTPHVTTPPLVTPHVTTPPLVTRRVTTPLRVARRVTTRTPCSPRVTPHAVCRRTNEGTPPASSIANSASNSSRFPVCWQNLYLIAPYSPLSCRICQQTGKTNDLLADFADLAARFDTGHRIATALQPDGSRTPSAPIYTV